MLLMTEYEIRGGVTQSSHKYAEANNKYMKNCDKNKESSCLMYLDANNLYGWAMSQKQPVGSFKWVKNVSMIEEKSMKDYCNDCDIRFILKVDNEYPKELHDLHSDLPILPQGMKVNKCNKLACTLYGKTNYIVHIRKLKQALKHGPVLKKSA